MRRSGGAPAAMMRAAEPNAAVADASDRLRMGDNILLPLTLLWPPAKTSCGPRRFRRLHTPVSPQPGRPFRVGFLLVFPPLTTGYGISGCKTSARCLRQRLSFV